MKGGPLYLRDLSEPMRNDFLEYFKANGMHKLIVAHERGEDIIIGRYRITKNCVVA